MKRWEGKGVEETPVCMYCKSTQSTGLVPRIVLYTFIRNNVQRTKKKKENEKHCAKIPNTYTPIHRPTAYYSFNVLPVYCTFSSNEK